MAKVAALVCDHNGLSVFVNSNVDPTIDPKTYDWTEDGWECIWDEAEITDKMSNDEADAWGDDDSPRMDTITSVVKDCNPDFVYDPEGPYEGLVPVADWK